MDEEIIINFARMGLKWACRVSEVTGIPLKEMLKRANVPEDYFKRCVHDEKYIGTYEEYDRLRDVLQQIEVDFVPDMTPSSDPEDPRNKTPQEVINRYHVEGVTGVHESDDPKATKRYCICCDKYLGTYGSWDPPLEALAFRSHGNYGTALYDPMNGKEHIEVFICDECAKKKADKIWHYTNAKPPRITTFLQEIHREAVISYLYRRFREQVEKDENDNSSDRK